MPAILTGLAPEVVLAIGLLAVICSYFLARGLIYIWEYTFGALMRDIAAILPGGWRVLGRTVIPDTSAAFRHAEAAVFTSLQNWAQGSEHAIAGLWHAMGSVWKWNAGIAEWLAKETAHTFDWLIHVRTPKITRALILAAFPAAFLAKLIASQIAKALPHVTKLVRVVEHTVTHTIVHTVTKAGAIVLPGPLGLPRIWSEIHGFTKRFARIHWRLRRLELLLGAAGAAALVARALGITTRCVRSGNVGKVARRLCGLSPKALEDLLGLIADALILTNICQVIVALQDGLAFVQPELTAFVTAVETWACYGDNERPPSLGAVTLSLPPTTGVVLSLP